MLVFFSYENSWHTGFNNKGRRVPTLFFVTIRTLTIYCDYILTFALQQMAPHSDCSVFLYVSLFSVCYQTSTTKPFFLSVKHRFQQILWGE